MILQAKTLEIDEDKSCWVDLRNQDGKYIGTMPAITFHALFDLLPGIVDSIKFNLEMTIEEL